MSAGSNGGEPRLNISVAIEPGSRADQDTAIHLEELNRSRDGDGEVQQVSLAGDFRLGGYVSAHAGTYDFGTNLPFPEDPEDIYALAMVSGESIRVRFWEGGVPTAEVEDHSFDSSGLCVRLRHLDLSEEDEDCSNSDERLVTAESEGRHELVIEASDGPPVRYLAHRVVPEGGGSTARDPDFVPGQAVITRAPSSLSPTTTGFVASAGVEAEFERHLRGSTYQVSAPSPQGFGAQSAMTRQETMEWIERLNADPDIEHASPNYRYAAATFSATSTAFNSNQSWHYDLIDAPQAWGAGLDGTGARIAVMDSGVFWNGQRWHEDLDDNINCLVSTSEGCFDALGDDGGRPIDRDEDNFHGTHVSGTVAALGGEDRPIGVAFASDLLPVRVLDGREGTLADIISGIEWAIGDEERRADVINLSLGSAADSQALEEALIEARAKGITSVAAAGNQSSDRDFFPAVYSSTISVSAVNCESQLSRFSNFGLWVDVAAPGGGQGNNGDCGDESFIVSTVGDDGIGGLTGTSMAAPHVAGAIGLIKGALEDDLNDGPDVMQALLREGYLTNGTANGVHDSELGWGILNIAGLDALTDALPNWAFLAPQPRRLNLVPGTDDYTLSLETVGAVDDSITHVAVSIENEVPWLEIEELGSFQYAVRLLDSELNSSNLRRTDLAVTYETDNRDTVIRYTIPVEIEEERDASPHFILLIPEDEEQGSEQWIVEASGNRYEFNIDPIYIEPGRYSVVIGSDLDGDGLLCVPGEACDTRTLSDEGSKTIDIHADSRHDLELTTRYFEEWPEQGGQGYSGVRYSQ